VISISPYDEEEKPIFVPEENGSTSKDVLRMFVSPWTEWHCHRSRKPREDKREKQESILDP
jgi:hypothetical protein